MPTTAPFSYTVSETSCHFSPATRRVTFAIVVIEPKDPIAGAMFATDTAVLASTEALPSSTRTLAVPRKSSPNTWLTLESGPETSQTPSDSKSKEYVSESPSASLATTVNVTEPPSRAGVEVNESIVGVPFDSIVTPRPSSLSWSPMNVKSERQSPKTWNRDDSIQPYPTR